MFDIELGDLVNLQRFYRKAPKKFEIAQNNTINSFAFGSRKEMIDAIDSEMIVRKPKFVSGSIQVQKAYSARPQAEVGSISRRGFSGWEEQQTGARRDSSRVATLLGRAKSEQKQIIRPARLRKRAAAVRTKKRALSFLRRTKKSGAKQLFMLSKRSGFKAGFYRFIRKKLQLVQTFSKKAQPNRYRWLDIGVDNYFRKHKPRDVWAASIGRVLR